MKNKFVTLALAVTFLIATNVKAELTVSQPSYDTLSFALSGWKDGNAVKKIDDSFGDLSIKDAFQFTFSKGEGNAVELTFDFGPVVYEQGLEELVGGVKDTLKFKDFSLVRFVTEDGLNIFTPTTVPTNAWSNGGWAPTTAVLNFTEGYDWEKLVETVLADGFNGYVAAHIQSIGNSGMSINEGQFELYFGPGGGETTTPEPATLAVLGLGLIGLGVARRRMKK